MRIDDFPEDWDEVDESDALPLNPFKGMKYRSKEILKNKNVINLDKNTAFERKKVAFDDVNKEKTAKEIKPFEIPKREPSEKETMIFKK